MSQQQLQLHSQRQLRDNQIYVSNLPNIYNQVNRQNQANTVQFNPDEIINRMRQQLNQPNMPNPPNQEKTKEGNK